MNEQNANVLTVSRDGITLAIVQVDPLAFDPSTSDGWCVVADSGIYHVYPTAQTEALHDPVKVSAVLKTVQKLIDGPIYATAPLTTTRMLIKLSNEVILATQEGQWLISWGNVKPLVTQSIYPAAGFVARHQSEPVMFKRDSSLGFGRMSQHIPQPIPTSEVNIPGINYAGKFIYTGGFLHWFSEADRHVTPIPVINPTIDFQDRLALEQVLRDMLANLNGAYAHFNREGFVAPQYNSYTSDDPQQHWFDMTGDQRDQQEIE